MYFDVLLRKKSKMNYNGFLIMCSFLTISILPKRVDHASQAAQILTKKYC